MNTTRFTLLRHGLPELADHLLGTTDSLLTAKGWQQMQMSSASLEWDVILSSPLRRCCDFAATLARDNKQTLRIDPAWQELDFGDWDGQLISTLFADIGSEPTLCDDTGQKNKTSYSQYWQQPFNHTPPNGETTANLLRRVTTSIEQLSRQHAGKQLLIVTHSGVMRIVLAWLLESRQQNNPHLSRVQLNHAATLSFSTYRDHQDKLWPQLLSFCNPEPRALDENNNSELA